MISTWWLALSTFEKVLWSITLAASLIFVIQTILTFVGADTGGDFDMDTDVSGLDADVDASSGMNLYTFRNLVNFLLGFGWTAILLKDSIRSITILLLLSVFIGLALVALVMFLFKWLSGMQQSGNIDVYRSAVGCHGQVYLTIPGGRQGEGKIQITINNAVREYTALTDMDTLKTGTPIKVIEVLSPSTLLVEELNPLII